MSDPIQTPFLRPGKIVLVVVLGIIVYLCSLIFWLPAGWVWHLSKPYIQLPSAIVVEQVSGQVWHGAVRTNILGHSLNIGWHIDGLYNDGAVLPLSWTLSTPASHLNGQLRFPGFDTLAATARGSVNIPEFSAEIRRSGGAIIEGDVTVDSFDLALSEGSVDSLNGRVRWGGGRVSWPMGGNTQSATLPPLKADIDEQQKRVDFLVSRQDNPDPLVSATLSPDGVMKIELFRRMLDLVNQPWSGNAAPGDVVFSVQQRVLPAAG